MRTSGEEKVNDFKRHNSKLNVLDNKALNPSQSPQLSTSRIASSLHNHNHLCCTAYNLSCVGPEKCRPADIFAPAAKSIRDAGKNAARKYAAGRALAA
jgi:hypothetical protein